MIETKFQELGFVAGKKRKSLLADFSFDASTPQRAEGGAVGQDEHFGPFFLGR